MDGPLMDHMHNNFFSNNKRKYPTYEYTLEKGKNCKVVTTTNRKRMKTKKAR